MTTLELRAELFREINPLLESEVLLQKILTFVKDLVRNQPKVDENPRQIPVSKRLRELPPSIKKLRGMVHITEEDIANDPRLAYIMQK
ncbi:MAG: hypothetical protein PUC50_03085 [Bacteroidales bacterium]|nr:hypothetical protein [Bacteroidales bacterium]